MRATIIRTLTPLLSIGLLAATAWVLHHELKAYHYSDVINHLKSLPGRQVAWAVFFTVASYLLLTGYDVLGLRYIRRKLDYGRTAITSFVGYVFSHNLTLLGGSAARYRIYSAWGISAWETAVIVLFCGVSFWLGFFGLGAILFLLDPIPVPPRLHLPFATTQPPGWLFMALVAGYLLLCGIRKRPLRFREWVLEIPSFGIASIQSAVAVVDWVLGGAVLFALLPASPDVDLSHVLQVFLLAQCAGMVSHVPGGLGVLETVVMLSLGAFYPAPVLLGTLVAYRGIYYLMPLALAALLLGLHEAAQRRAQLARAWESAGKWLPTLAPRLFAMASFVGGVLLIISNATPVQGWRAESLAAWVPLPLVEAAHATAAVVGVALLIVARGLQRRIEQAYFLALGLLALGIVAALLKGMEVEEAIYLSVMLAALIPSRGEFYRRAPLVGPRLQLAWLLSAAFVLVASAWLGHFAFKHQEYHSGLWVEFSRGGDLSRFLRGSLIAWVTLAAYVAWRPWFRPTRPRRIPVLTEAEAVAAVVRQSPRAYAQLAEMGGRKIQFNDARNAFVMYEIHDRSWIAWGDPLGTGAQRAEVAWRFHERCERAGGWTVFHNVHPDCLPIYVDLGLNLMPLGDEAVVDLAAACQRPVSLEAGITAEVLDGPRTSELVSEFLASGGGQMAITNQHGWTTQGLIHAISKAQFPLVVGRVHERASAIGLLFCGAAGGEVGLGPVVRLSATSPIVPQHLLPAAMQWAQARGYREFNLGLAPSDAAKENERHPAWSKLAPLLFGPGERLGGHQGLRHWMNEWNPSWTPIHLACPGGLALPRVLGHVTEYLSGIRRPAGGRTTF